MAARFSVLGITLLLGAQALADQTVQKPTAAFRPDARPVDVVIALDVSGSMSGLIASAKQRLWDIVNELGRAQPQPDLRIAILTYGNPAYGEQSGYVSLDQPFTRDLDAVNETLFGFGTNGGDEYVARVVNTSIDRLQWSTQSDALRVVFVAGNESATQDPQIPIQQVGDAASRHGIVINAIYCGDDDDPIASGWRAVSALTNGMYASIDQSTAAVANIATPMDQELAELNAALNGTYLAFGASGEQYRENQHAQDRNAVTMSGAALASRVVSKAGTLYQNSTWDLIDAVAAGLDLETVESDELPAEMQSMSASERAAHVTDKARERDEIRQRIGALDRERREYIARERASNEGGPLGLDEAMRDGLRMLAEARGFTFE